MIGKLCIRVDGLVENKVRKNQRDNSIEFCLSNNVPEERSAYFSMGSSIFERLLRVCVINFNH